jgi:U3 small nucleolar ribonucleoprotein protein LCP5
MALMTDSTPADDSSVSQSKSRYTEEEPTNVDGIYRPPRLAPMPYVEKSKNKDRAKRAPIPSALATLAADPEQPFAETTSGLGGAPGMASGRAQYLQRLKDYEEENFTRVIMKKSDAKRRLRDEEDLALGGDLGGGPGRGGRRRAGGLEDEFGEVLRSVSRVTARDGLGQGDGYEELRQRGKKKDVLERSRENAKRRGSDDDEPIDAPRFKKRSRFEQETKVAKKKLSKR